MINFYKKRRVFLKLFTVSFLVILNRILIRTNRSNNKLNGWVLKKSDFE